MELTQLRYFIAVAEDENMNRAAERLHISQPAVSRQISNLEAELGIRLFDRAEGRLRLSSAGRDYFTEVRRCLAELDRINERTKRIASGQAGILRIGLTGPAARFRIVTEAFRHFRSAHPQVKLILSQMFSQDQFAALEEGTLDIGIASVPRDRPSTLDRHDLLTGNLGAVMASDHPLAGRERLRLADLKDQSFVYFSRETSSGSYEHLMQVCLAGGLAPKIAQEADSESAILELVSGGKDVSFFVDPGSNPLPAGLVFRPIDDLVWPVAITMFWRRDHSSPVARQFLEAVIGFTRDGRDSKEREY